MANNSQLAGNRPTVTKLCNIATNILKCTKTYTSESQKNFAGSSVISTKTYTSKIGRAHV